MPKTFAEYKQKIREMYPNVSDEKLLELWNSPHYNKDRNWINNQWNSPIYQLTPFKENDYWIVDNHEFTHYLQKTGKDYTPEYLNQALSEAGCSKLKDIFYNLEDLRNQGVPDEMAKKLQITSQILKLEVLK